MLDTSMEALIAIGALAKEAATHPLLPAAATATASAETFGRYPALR
ncbi:hypothetical protein [Marinobacter sp. ATCH36]|nr:hypothetical protein [Marinobacter sp. ATCH36]MCL7942617.1 hypothetical protein [Marinobacter sp. ATCH36]